MSSSACSCLCEATEVVLYHESIRGMCARCFIVFLLWYFIVNIAFYSNFAESINRSSVEPKSPKKKFAVLISGTGTNLQALIDHVKNKVDIKLTFDNVLLFGTANCFHIKDGVGFLENMFTLCPFVMLRKDNQRLRLCWSSQILTESKD